MSAMEKKAHYEDEEEEKEKGKNIMEVEVKKKKGVIMQKREGERDEREVMEDR